jgi:hypothetical protein
MANRLKYQKAIGMMLRCCRSLWIHCQRNRIMKEGVAELQRCARMGLCVMSRRWTSSGSSPAAFVEHRLKHRR